MSNYPPDLRSHYKAGRLIPFLGAGVSASVSWEVDGVFQRPPSWKELVDHAAIKLGFSDPDLLRVRGNDLQILEYFVSLKDSRDPLVNWLVKAVSAPDDALEDSVIHAALAECVNFRLMYTTNYDDLLERTLALHKRAYVTLAREHDFPTAFEESLRDHDTCQIVKFHGDLSNRDTMVLTESDYQRRLKLETEMDLRLRSDLLGRAVLFLGYSFRDPNVSYLFGLVQEAFKQLPASQYGRRAFIAIPDPSHFERRLFERRGMDVIPIDSARPAEDVAELLGFLRS